MSAMEMTIEHLCGGPENAEHEEDAYERRQVCDALEDRHEDQTAHTDYEDSLTLCLCEVARVLVCTSLHLRHVKLALEAVLQDERRKNHRNDGRDENLADDANRCDKALVPEHDGGDVADGRECAA